MNLTWTDEAPTVAGWYWHTWEGENPRRSIIEVEDVSGRSDGPSLDPFPDGTLGVLSMPFGYWAVGSKVRERRWAGPIPRPSEPRKTPEPKLPTMDQARRILSDASLDFPPAE